MEKNSADLIYNSLIACLPMQELYNEFGNFISEIINKVNDFTIRTTIEEDLKHFLKISIDKKDEYMSIIDGNKEMVGYVTILSIIGVSREQMKNIIIPNHSYFSHLSKPTINKVLKDIRATDNLVNLLLDGSTNSELNEILNGDSITLNRFNLRSFSNLKELLDKVDLQRFLEDTFLSRMENKKGYYAEKLLGDVVTTTGYTFESGVLPQLAEYFSRTSTASDSTARNPRIDLIIPSISNPKILIESTYNLTTASGQTKKMDANDSLFRAIKQYERDTGEELVFINFIEGAGWKSRGLADVSRLVSSCDYALNFNTISQLIDIIEKHLL